MEVSGGAFAGGASSEGASEKLEHLVLIAIAVGADEEVRVEPGADAHLANSA
jgi:hypothetical protein